jgi:hypothetical protein
MLRAQESAEVGKSCITSEAAGQLIIKKLVKDRVYRTVPSKCLFANLEEETKGYFLFAVRFDPECCGVQTESTLLDRFAVIRPTYQIVWWDVSDPECFKPYSAYLSWRKSLGKRQRLTPRSTRTPPALPSALSQHLASPALFSALAQAGPVSFFR